MCPPLELERLLQGSGKPAAGGCEEEQVVVTEVEARRWQPRCPLRAAERLVGVDTLLLAASARTCAVRPRCSAFLRPRPRCGPRGGRLGFVTYCIKTYIQNCGA